MRVCVCVCVCEKVSALVDVDTPHHFLSGLSERVVIFPSTPLALFFFLSVVLDVSRPPQLSRSPIVHDGRSSFHSSPQ